MDDYLEIDLRKIIKNIVSNWYWVILPAVMLGLAAFILTDVPPIRYSASSKLLLTDAPVTINLTDQYSTNVQSPTSELILRNLLLSDNIGETLFEDWECPEGQSCTLSEFMENVLSVDISEEGKVVTLRVESSNPEDAASLANDWAELAIQNINLAYYGIDQNQISYFEEQVNKTYADLNTAASNLATFEGQKDNRSILKNELDSLLDNQRETLLKNRNLELAQNDLDNLISLLDLEPQDAAVDISYQLSYLLILSRIYSLPVSDSELVSPFDIRADYTIESQEGTVVEFQTMLENWLNLIEDELLVLTQDGNELNQEILMRQAEIRAIDNEFNILSDEYALKHESYSLVLKKYEEVSLTQSETLSGEAQLISSASEMTAMKIQSQNNKNRNAVIGFIAGAFIGMAGVLFAGWWNDPNEPENHQVS